MVLGKEGDKRQPFFDLFHIDPSVLGLFSLREVRQDSCNVDWRARFSIMKHKTRLA